ncbi:sulfate ABC transporter ATP-binding protein [Shinella sumterensis]|uniref:sulfate/molybdate ABC transporter ATP-binding protein n=1 Tax=Shinella sumterensis TaxID=1967501 RepID=UPI00106E6BB4|nr:sulfate/molybdate ABC transporter ATP-binding protein [Shinella sumterensis]MCD1263432.1 sulfate ABC transporter ATP-binding protein [Shinella sumterensis]TFE99810.1 sulfate ABC transporter ATP-binding protein [Shinella sumterensis]
MDVSVKNLRKEFDRYPALHDVSLDIRSGELIALLGPSGSGKTTLLRLIAGLEQPTLGSIHFGDEDASHKTVQERNIGFVFQHYALFRHMTVADNIAFGLTVRPRGERPPKAEIRRRVSELLEMVQLSGLEKRYPNQLSGGQRQRVALARAMAIEPRVLLLDEPFGALDAKVRKELRRWLREFHDRTGHTTVFVTHDQEEALELADRVVVMSQGKIEQVGSSDDVYDRPNSPFVFSFIGDSASVPVSIVDGSVRFRGDEIGVAAPEGDIVSGEATLFFRPQDVAVVTDPSAPALEGRVVTSRRLAGTRIADLDIGGADDPLHVEIEVPLDAQAANGTSIRFRPLRFKLFAK